MKATLSLARQPLVHFLLIGAAFFALFEIAGGVADNPRTVVVDREALHTFLQFRAKAFDPDLAERMLAGLSDEDFDRLVEDYVREEVLYREAQAMEMAQNDYIIKRRLIQKIEFVTTGFIESAAEVGEDEIVAWYDKNRDDYYVDPFVTFTHVFFDGERRGLDAAKSLAAQTLDQLNRDGVAFTEGPRRGDRFLYHTNYVERTPDFIASHFGEPLAQEVFALAADDKRWHGPFQSPYGYHLVMLAKKADGHYPPLAEIRDQVGDDAQRQMIRDRSDAAIKAIVDSYDVRITYRRPAQTDEAATTL